MFPDTLLTVTVQRGAVTPTLFLNIWAESVAVVGFPITEVMNEV